MKATTLACGALATAALLAACADEPQPQAVLQQCAVSVLPDDTVLPPNVYLPVDDDSCEDNPASAHFFWIYGGTLRSNHYYGATRNRPSGYLVVRDPLKGGSKRTWNNAKAVNRQVAKLTVKVPSAKPKGILSDVGKAISKRVNDAAKQPAPKSPARVGRR